MSNTSPKKTRIAQNAIYAEPGNQASGLLVLSDLASATAFRDRFRSGTYTIPSDSPLIPDLKEMVGVTVNEDGSVTRPEVFPSQGNGYDSYANTIGGFLRKDTPYAFEPQALGKMALIALDALHEQALSEDEAVAADAKGVLSALRSFDGVAEAQTVERIAARKREAGITVLMGTGLSRERAEALLSEPVPAEVPLAPPVEAEATGTQPRKGKNKRESSEAVVS